MLESVASIQTQRGNFVQSPRIFHCKSTVFLRLCQIYGEENEKNKKIWGEARWFVPFHDVSLAFGQEGTK
ncbi:MAG: hypothetical protein K2J84_02210, partial [Bacteroidaceae bacterium]|nr:hypothetical protein [Bacteroidaceae bacterium]